jgi:hypothetical protein
MSGERVSQDVPGPQELDDLAKDRVWIRAARP